MSNLDYWIEAVSESFDGVGLVATPKLIEQVAENMQGAHEEIGQAIHEPEHPAVQEVENLKRQAAHKEELVICQACHGRGFTIDRVRCRVCNGDKVVRRG